MPRALRYSTLLILLLTLAAALVPATALARTVASDPTTSIGDLPPLQPKRTGISDNEPDYCPDTVLREEPNSSVTNTDSIESGPSTFVVKELDPGTTYRHCFYLLNRKKSERTFSITTVDVFGSLDPTIRIDTSEPKVVGTWIKPLMTKLTLLPGERIKVPYRFEVPAQPPAGSVSGGIRIEDTTGQDASAAGGAQLQPSLVLQVQATFPGGEAKLITVKDVRAPKLLIRGIDAPRFRVRYVAANEGTVVDFIQPQLQIEGLLGRRVATIKSPADVIVPRSAQPYRVVWEDLPWIGRYSPKIVIKSEAGTRTTELPALWILPPWPYLLGLAIAIALAVFALIRRRRAVGWRAYLDEDEDGDDADQWDVGADPYR